MMTKKQITAWRIIFVLYLITVGYLCFGHFSSLQQAPKTILGFPSDKVVHFMMFIPFPILTYLSFGKFPGSLGKAFLAIALTFIAGAVIAAGTEIGQGLTTYRSSDPRDFRVDLLGLGLGTLIIIISKSVNREQ